MAAAEAGIHKKKEALLALEPLLGKQIEVLCAQNRVLRGTLKGFDSNMNLVLANAVEDLRDLIDPMAPRFESDGTVASRKLGALIIRGGCVMSVCPSAGLLTVDNPFV